MARALGFHLRGEKVNYALVDRDPEEGIVVLAAGETTTEAVNFLYQKLSGGRPLPWAVARFKEGNPIPQLPQSWTLGHPAPQALLQPSTAAAWWEFENGRLEPEELFLWLMPGHLHFSLGMPGLGPAGSVLRRGPLKEALSQAIARSTWKKGKAAIRVDGEAPGGDLLRESMTSLGFEHSFLFPPVAEQGADPAAAGAALGALLPSHPATFSPRLTHKLPSGLKPIQAFSLLLLILTLWISSTEEIPLAHPPDSVARLEIPNQDSPPPKALVLLIQRRRHFIQQIRQAVKNQNSLQEMVLVASPESPRVSLTVQLRPQDS